jgi:hypothetical protein
VEKEFKEKAHMGGLGQISGNPVKQQDGLVVLRRGEVLPVGAEGDAVD